MKRVADQWSDYECLYAGSGQKIERWKDVILQRPDPTAIWSLPKTNCQIDAVYHRSSHGGGSWEFFKPLPDFWNITYRDLKFKVAPLGFKHTGVFPEQAVNWDILAKIINSNASKEIRILNLFAYTGGATLACAAANATEIVHVDASKGMVQWAKENVALSGLQNQKIRFIVDDCLKFIKREQRRGRTYHGIIMDPPSYGRGPNNEVWKFEEQITNLVDEAGKLLAEDALFFLLNTYTTGFSSLALGNLLQSNPNLKQFENIVNGDLVIPITQQNLYLPSGCFAIATHD